MKKVLTFLLAGGLLCGAAPLAHAETQRATLMNNFDLDGEAADDDQIVTAANGDLLDSKTFTITAQPDACRLIDMTVTDANSSITSGKVTITGTDCLGAARVCTFDFAVAATRGSGVKTLPVTTGFGTSCYLGAVTSVVTNALATEGGAGVDLMTLGYTSAVGKTRSTYGKAVAAPAMGQPRVDPFGYYTETLPITTSGVASTTVTSVDSNAAFTSVVAGDLLAVSINGMTYTRRVTARASANSITVSSALKIPAGGIPFTYQHRYTSTDPEDLVGAINVDGFSTADFTWSVDANADTGGVIMSLECSSGIGPEWPAGRWVQVATTTVATGGTQSDTMEAIDLTAASFRYCRIGFRFGTLTTDGDDGDTADEDINCSVTLRK